MYSFVVSIYKVEKYLPQCVDSILAQTYKDFEVILVDDGSPDRCPQICNEYEAKDSRVRVIHKENAGLVSTRKVGTDVATGEYICFVDGDDYIANDMLATYERVLKTKKVDIICAGFSSYYGQSASPVKLKIPTGLYEKEQLQKEIYPKMLSTVPFFSFFIFPSMCTKCFKRTIVKNVYRDVPDAISLGEDVAASYPALLEADSIYVTDYYGYVYRQNLTSMTHTYDKNLYKKIRNLILHLKRIDEKKGWNADSQIDEYTVYLLYLARNNELIYNTFDKFRDKREKMKQYLQDDLFKRAIFSVQIERKKDKFILFCFRHKLLLPLYLVGRRNIKKET